jgi:hypothetical protein
MRKRGYEAMKPREAARDAILDEITILGQSLNSNNVGPGTLGQLDDS